MADLLQAPSKVAFRLLRLRQVIEDRITRLKPLEVHGSGQTVGEDQPLVGDITFDYCGRNYKLTIEDLGEMKASLSSNLE